MSATAKKSRASTASERFIKVGDNGALLKPNASEWVAVLDTRANLLWAVEVLARMNYKKALAAVKKLTVAGRKDWQLPSVEALFCLADRSRASPAIDVDFFPNTPSEWFWTGTVYAPSPSDCAWIVYFSNGDSSWDDQSYEYHVRAVCPGQSLGSLAA